MCESFPNSNPDGRFPTTRWSQVIAAGDGRSPDVDAALAELCNAYWFPLYAFIRRKGDNPDRALDLTQAYFARLLEKRIVVGADPTRGRFRAFLLTDLSRFLADEHERERAIKRGGGRSFVSIDARDAEGRFLNEPSHERTAERLFERDWALALIGRVFDRIGARYAETGRGPIFAALKSLVTSEPAAASYATLAEELGTTEGGLRVAVHRLRARFATKLRAEVAATLDDTSPGEVDDELRAILGVLRD